jgi:hypothetical protein
VGQERSVSSWSRLSERDRRGVYVLAAAVVLAAIVVAFVVLKNRDDAATQNACAPIANPYGKPPAGYAYKHPGLKQSAEIEDRLGVKELEQYGLDITLVLNGTAVKGYLLSMRSPDHKEISTIYDAVRNAVPKSVPVHKASIGDRSVNYVVPKQGGRTTWALEGCTLVLAAGVTSNDGLAIANAVFND